MLGLVNITIPILAELIGKVCAFSQVLFLELIEMNNLIRRHMRAFSRHAICAS